MWTEKSVLPWLSAAATSGALSRMMCSQSWPQLGASTTRVCSKPDERISWMALLVASIQPEAFWLPHGSLPMLMRT